MFVSHPLTTQSLLGSILDDRRVAHLEKMKKELEDDKDSAMIIMTLLSVIERTVHPTNIPLCGDQSKGERPRPPENKSLILQAQFRLEKLSKNEKWAERYTVQRCQRCDGDPHNFCLVSCCSQRFCISCFDQLPNRQGNVDSQERQCSSCKLDIESFVFCSQSFPSALHPAEDLLTKTSPNKKRANATPGKSENGPLTKKNRSSKPQTRNQREGFLALLHHQGQSEDNENDAFGNFIEFEPEPKPELDWIEKIGAVAPGAKKNATEKLIKQWLEEDKKAKIVVFVEFRGTMKLLEYICVENKWGCAKVSYWT